MRPIVLIWLLVINIAAIIFTASDKFTAAHRPKARRVPERSLLFIAAAGGSVAMFLTMLIIRHKTQKPKFILGIPIIIAAQAAVICYLYTLGVRI